MKKSIVKAGIFAAAAFSLTACGEVFNFGAPGIASVPQGKDVPAMKLVAGEFPPSARPEDGRGPVATVALKSQGLRSVLRNLKPGCGSLQSCVAALDNDTNADLFKGLSGITGRAFLEAARQSQNGNVTRSITIRGQILPTCLHSNQTGYAYNAANGTLRLCVYMVTQTGNVNARNKKTKWEYFHVEATGVTHEVKDTSSGAEANVFPAAAAATNLTINAAMASGFMSKVYVRGATISVKDYWVKNANNVDSINPPAPGPNDWDNQWGPSNPPNNPKIAAIFAPDVDACVDMMFKSTTPPSGLSNTDAAGIHYCLGRCDNPPIVNTR